MKTTTYENCRFCIESKGTGILYEYPEALEDVMDGSIWIDDVFNSVKYFPDERGVYQCDIEVKIWEPCYPDWEGDLEVVAVNFKKLL